MPSLPWDLPNPGIETRSPALLVDSLLSELPGKSKNTGVGSLSFLQGNFPTQESNWGLLHRWQILNNTSRQIRNNEDKGSVKIYLNYAFKKTVFLLFLQRDFNYARRTSKKLLRKFFFFNCGIIAIQCCIGFCCKNKVNQLCTCAQSCPTLCEPMDCSPPGSSVHGIFQARILEWVSISFSRGSSQPRN